MAPEFEQPSRCHFTLVDDDPHTLFFVQRTLVQAFPLCEVITFDDGAAALQYLNHNPTDCLVTDQSMRHMNGDELVRRLKEGGLTLPTVMVSSSPYAQEAAEAAGVVFLEKNRIASDLAEAVRGLLAKGGSCSRQVSPAGDSEDSLARSRRGRK